MAYATPDDVAMRLGRTLDPAEESRVEAILEDVSALVDEFCRRTFPDPPPVLRGVVCSETIRILNSNPGISSEVVGDVEVKYASTNVGLSRQAEKILSRYRLSAIASARVAGYTWRCDSPEGDAGDFTEEAP